MNKKEAIKLLKKLANSINNIGDFNNGFNKDLKKVLAEIKEFDWDIKSELFYLTDPYLCKKIYGELPLIYYLGVLENVIKLFHYNAPHHKDRYKFIPLELNMFYNSLKTYSNNNINYHELGAGAGIKCLIAEIMGFNATGYEISPELIKTSKQLGLSKYVKHKDILKLDKLSSDKNLLYYYQPLTSSEEMYNIELNLINKMNKGDFIVRYVLYSKQLPNTKQINNEVFELV